MKLLVNAARRLRQRAGLLIPTVLLLGIAPAYPGQAPTREYRLDKSVFPDQVVQIEAVRNLQSESFPRDLEIEVKNISGRPLYHLHFVMLFDSSRRGVPLHYGDPRLTDLRQLADSQDRPLEPGTKQVLRVPGAVGRATAQAITEGRIPLAATKDLTLFFQTASFGDGSGYTLKDYHRAR